MNSHTTRATLALFTLTLSILLMTQDVEARNHFSRGQNNEKIANRDKKMMNTTQHQFPQPIKRASKVIIWDLGGTLLKTDRFGMASHIGLSDFIWYPLLDGKNPIGIQDKVFDVLEGLAASQPAIKGGANSPDGRILPAVMCDWLAGIENGDSISKRAHQYIAVLEAKNKFYFSSVREKRLVENTINAMFDATVLAKHTKVIKPGLRLLDHCSKQIDAQGKPLHRMLILSNWDANSFDNLYASHNAQKVFKYFHADDIIISGDIQLIKPDHALFNYIVKTHRLNPSDCIFIDDQIENCTAAKRVGMHALLLENNDYGKLKRQLDELGVF